MKQLLNKTKGDQVIWAVVLILSFISLLAVYSSTGSLAYRQDKNASYFLVKQVMVLGLGLLITYWVHNVNYTKFARVAVLLYLNWSLESIFVLNEKSDSVLNSSSALAFDG